MNLRGFPRWTLRGDRTIHRIHRSTHAPWWFSADGSGRFDPVGTEHGACYLAERPLGAWAEVLRKPMLIAEADVHDRALLSVPLGRDLRVANVTSRRALAFGVTATIGGADDYEESQAFSAAALAAGLAGVRYLLRDDPAKRLYGIAVFGPPGTPAADDPAWPGESGPLPISLIEDAAGAFGNRVLPAP